MLNKVLLHQVHVTSAACGINNALCIWYMLILLYIYTWNLVYFIWCMLYLVHLLCMVNVSYTIFYVQEWCILHQVYFECHRKMLQYSKHHVIPWLITSVRRNRQIRAVDCSIYALVIDSLIESKKSKKKKKKKGNENCH